MTTWRLFGALLRHAPWWYALSIMLQLPRRLSRLVPGLLLKVLFDRLAGASDLGSGFWWLLALLLGVAVGRATLLVGTMSIERVPLQRSVTLLRANLLRQILRRPGALGLPLPTGDAANRLQQDPVAIASALAMIIYTGGVAVEVLVALAIMASIDAPLTALAVLPVLVGSLAVQFASGRVARYRRQGRDAAGAMQAYLSQVFGAVQALQAAGAERAAAERLGALGRARRRAALRERLFADGALGLLSAGGASAATGAVLLLGGASLRAGSFSVGDFALFVSYLTLVGDFVGLLIGEVVRFRQAGVAHERLLPLLAGAPPQTLVQPLAPDEPEPGPATGETQDVLLEARGLCYQYPDSARGIAGVNLRVRRGQLVVITGRIGAGKTTLLRVLLGLLPRDAGEIRWNGVRVDDPPRFFGPPRTAYTPQVPTLFSATLRENILLGLPEDDAALREAVALAALDADAATLEAGLDTVVGPRGVKLSGGQVQRAAAARMLARRPQLLVVDDLSSALDVETERSLWERIENAKLRIENDAVNTDATGECSAQGAEADADFSIRNSQFAILAVSHRHALLRRADQVVLLDEGAVAAVGTADELLRSSALFRQLWHGKPAQDVAAVGQGS